MLFSVSMETLHSFCNYGDSEGTISGRGGSRDLTTLEFIEMVSGLVSTLATAVMCSRGGEGVVKS